jgi:hypothetical protein
MRRTRRAFLPAGPGAARRPARNPEARRPEPCGVRSCGRSGLVHAAAADYRRKLDLDTLVEEPKRKWLVTCPSLSPENTHPGGVSVCAGPTMDMRIIRDLFSNGIRAAEILGLDEDFRRKAAEARKRLARNRIGKRDGPRRPASIEWPTARTAVCRSRSPCEPSTLVLSPLRIA